MFLLWDLFINLASVAVKMGFKGVAVFIVALLVLVVFRAYLPAVSNCIKN